MVGELAPLLLSLAGDLLPVSFDPVPIHVVSLGQLFAEAMAEASAEIFPRSLAKFLCSSVVLNDDALSVRSNFDVEFLTVAILAIELVIDPRNSGVCFSRLSRPVWHVLRHQSFHSFRDRVHADLLLDLFDSTVGKLIFPSEPFPLSSYVAVPSSRSRATLSSCVPLAAARAAAFTSTGTSFIVILSSSLASGQGTERKAPQSQREQISFWASL
jgi:hypothetical protein